MRPIVTAREQHALRQHWRLRSAADELGTETSSSGCDPLVPGSCGEAGEAEKFAVDPATPNLTNPTRKNGEPTPIESDPGFTMGGDHYAPNPSIGGGAGRSAPSSGGSSSGGSSSPSSSSSSSAPSSANGLKGQAITLKQLYESEGAGSSVGGYSGTVDQPWDEHATGYAIDLMNPKNPDASRQEAFDNGANYVLWQQKQWNPDGSTSDMPDRGSPTENHFDHMHINTDPGKRRR